MSDPFKVATARIGRDDVQLEMSSEQGLASAVAVEVSVVQGDGNHVYEASSDYRDFTFTSLTVPLTTENIFHVIVTAASESASPTPYNHYFQRTSEGIKVINFEQWITGGTAEGAVTIHEGVDHEG